MYQSVYPVFKKSSIYLALAVERETEFCFLENQEVEEL